jgi:hypothetical protein
MVGNSRTGHNRSILQRRTGLDKIGIYYRGGQDRAILLERTEQDWATGQDTSILQRRAGLDRTRQWDGTGLHYRGEQDWTR